MKSCIAVMKFITARDVLIHYGGYDFMPSEKSIFRIPKSDLFPVMKFLCRNEINIFRNEF